MIVTNTFLDKCNTIIENSNANTGVNPIMQLYYGNVHTRCLIHFPIDKLRRLYEDKTYPELYKIKHVLKLWNVSDINVPGITKRFPDSFFTNYRERAASYELILFKVPKYWEAGRGFDFTPVKTCEGYRGYSEYGSTWYNATTDTKWDNPGIYSIDVLKDELDSEESKIIVATQRFDFGNEVLEMDITDIVNDMIEGTEENNGFCLAFAPQFEKLKTVRSQYSGFFSNATNTFFEPYLQTTYDDVISDDRVSFYMDKPNRLYFYSNVGGNSVNLDEMPRCEIEGVQYQSTQATKGVYYIDYRCNSSTYEPVTMLNDKWTNIVYNGVQCPDVELRFTTMSPEGYYHFGIPYDTDRQPRYDVSLSGINGHEKVPHGEIRRLTAHVRAQFTSDQECHCPNVEYRVYAMMERKELVVIDWQKVDVTYNANTFLLDTDSLVPQEYHIDIRVKNNDEMLVEKDACVFEIVSDATHMLS